MNDGENGKKWKSRIFSLVGILAGCLLVFAGYWIMQQMLDKRQTRLLSQSGTIRTAAEEQTDVGQEESRTKLTREELSDILFREAFVVDVVPHEPYGRQMTMQEAIDSGQSWVDAFCDTYAFPGGNSTIQFEEVSAQLCTGEMGDESTIAEMTQQTQQNEAQTSPVWSQIVLEDRGNQLAESMYGYWNITFSGTGISIYLKINAVSGQVMRVNIETDFYETEEYISAIEALPVRDILQNYINSFELEGDYQWNENEGNYSVSFADDMTFFAERFPLSEDVIDMETGEVYDGVYTFYMSVEVNVSNENTGY